jgi:hypothetical protein
VIPRFPVPPLRRRWPASAGGTCWACWLSRSRCGRWRRPVRWLPPRSLPVGTTQTVICGWTCALTGSSCPCRPGRWASLPAATRGLRIASMLPWPGSGLPPPARRPPGHRGRSRCWSWPLTRWTSPRSGRSGKQCWATPTSPAATAARTPSSIPPGSSRPSGSSRWTARGPSGTGSTLISRWPTTRPSHECAPPWPRGVPGGAGRDLQARGLLVWFSGLWPGAGRVPAPVVRTTAATLRRRCPRFVPAGRWRSGRRAPAGRSGPI